MRTLILLSTLFISLASYASPNAVVKTSLGSFTIELDSEKAPVTVKNFIQYAKEGAYKNTIFHRVIPGFMAQGGGFTSDLSKVQTHAPIKNEASNGLKNKVASVAMARTANPNSATNQFFINYKDNQFLDYSPTNPGYAVFGQVIDGFDVVKKMATKPTITQNQMQNVPVEPIVIQSVTIQN